ncbi:MAG: transcriptional regulator NrdR [Planctomycetota bacterium]|jgi:transcriptional repressor NrdR
MKCPYCKTNNDRVIDSRTSGDAFVVRRRRECLECGKRFTTYEKVEDTPLRVIKKDSSRDTFDRNKILKGVLKACEKRSVSTDRLEEMVNNIEAQLYEMFDKEVSSKFIGRLVMDELKEIDQVAYVRFASVYREFKDINQFLDELKPLLATSEQEEKKSRAQRQ